MKYAAGMGSGAIIHLPSITNLGSAVKKLTGKGGYRDTQTTW
jgi:hypothetical protein